LNFCILMKRIFLISLKLNFTPSTVGCYVTKRFVGQGINCSWWTLWWFPPRFVASLRWEDVWKRRGPSSEPFYNKSSRVFESSESWDRLKLSFPPFLNPCKYFDAPTHYHTPDSKTLMTRITQRDYEAFRPFCKMLVILIGIFISGFMLDWNFHFFHHRAEKATMERRTRLVTSLDRESIASQCMDILRNPRISKWISIKAWIIGDWYPYKHGYPFMDISCLRISIAKYLCMDIRAWIFMWISTLVWIIEDWHPKIMDIHVDIRGFLEIHAWVCYGFLDQGSIP